MKCSECGSENSDSSKFCKKCGAKLSEGANEIVSHGKSDNSKDRNILITALAIVVIVLAGIVVYASGVLTPEVPLETQEFDQFSLDVPVGSNFVISEQHTTDKKNIMVLYDNKGDYYKEAYSFGVGNKLSEDLIPDEAELIEQTDNSKIYRYGETHEILASYDESQILLIGDDLNTIKHMANSYKEKDISKLASKVTEPKQPTQSTQQTSATPTTTTALTILGGSISTGGGLSDKTYAKVFVGPEHAGENVKIQIWYSRDGGYLNNGNMVPKTVSSDGYIEVASASAYEKFPDTAEINIYNNNGALLDTYTVYLNPESGTQTF